MRRMTYSRTLSSWHPEAFDARYPFLKGRQAVLRRWRQWFEGQGFDEVETPCLQISPCVEVHVRGFKTQLEGLKRDGQGEERWLHTSPEFAMKKLLVAGVGKIFQFARVFRNGEITERHQPEFTLLEWYRAHATYQTLMDDCASLLREAAEATGRNHVSWQGLSCDITAPPGVLTVAEAFQNFCGIDLLSTLPEETGKLAEQARAKGYRVAPDDRWEDIFFRLMLDAIEPNLGRGRPTILCEYPLSQAILSRQKPEDPRVAERFELYVAGLELANAYGELTDATIQRQRFKEDMDLREKLYGHRFPVDEGFLDALQHGMPPCAGIALGFDRMVMLATGASDIRQVLWEPVA